MVTSDVGPSRNTLTSPGAFRRAFELVLIAAAVIGIAAWYMWRQPIISVNGGLGWDGTFYDAMYRHFAGQGPFPQEAFPFCRRLATPWLASLIPLSELQAFLVLNVGAGALCALFVYWTARSMYAVVPSLLFTLPLLIGYLAPIRFSPYYPAYTDPLFMMFAALAALCLIRRQPVWCAAALFAASIVREVGLYVLLVFAMWSLVARRDTVAQRWGPPLFLVAAWGTSVALSSAFDCSGTSFRTALNWAYTRTTDYREWLRFVASLLVTLAPFAVCAVRPAIAERLEDGRDDWGRTPNDVKALGWLWFAAAALMAFVGGSDSTRIFFSLYPLVWLGLSDVLERGWLSALTFIAVTGAVNQFPRKIPEPLNVIADNDTAGYFSLFPEFADLSVALALIAFVAMARAALLTARASVEAVNGLPPQRGCHVADLQE